MITNGREITGSIEEYDVKFIRLAFFDLFGNQKNISIMPQELKQVFAHDLSFDASAVNGFSQESQSTKEHTSDLFPFPDTSALTTLPQRPQIGRVVRMYYEVRYPDGSAYALDTRSLLNRMRKQVGGKGMQVIADAEYEFYLFKRDESGRPTAIPYGEARYCDIALLDKGEGVRREIHFDLEEMDIHPESSHHKQGPGQNEIDSRFDEVMPYADNLMIFRSVVDMVALPSGLEANFYPKPLQQQPGNGLRIGLSLFRNDESLFAQEQGHYMEAFLSGIFRHIRKVTLFLNLETESYLRLGKNKTPKCTCHPHSNRSALIRIPAANEHHTRIEVRSPDPSCNPYLALTLLIAVDIEGIEDRLTAKEFHGNVYLYHEGLQELPGSLQKTLQLTQNSSFTKRVLREKLLQGFLNAEIEQLCM